MRDQYAGDVSDVLKFAFLRALVASDKTLGVAWYYDPGDDGRSDGRHLEWRNEPAWGQLDFQLYEGLRVLSERTLVALELAAIWPQGTVFHRQPVPSRLIRDQWVIGMRSALSDADIVFLDPDNGIGKISSKHATISEIQQFRRKDRAIVFITFPGRNGTHDELVQRLHSKIRSETQATTVGTLRTCVSIQNSLGTSQPRFRWFTIVDPDETLIGRAHAFTEALSMVPRVRAQLIWA